MNKYWQGSAPLTCDACGEKIEGEFSDVKSTFGPWGNFCPGCAKNGPGIGRYGTGLGQKYEKQPDGRWLKTAG